MKHNSLPILVILSAYMVVYSRAHSYRCPPCSCTRTSGSISVDCSNKGLTEVPDLCQDDVTHFVLNGNKIPRIKRNAFVKCGHLINLQMNTSKVKLLDTGAFEGLSRLQVLDLRENLLGLDDDQLNKSDVMAPLINLEELHMSKNYGLSKNNYRTLKYLMRSLPREKLQILTLGYIASEADCSNTDIGNDFFESIKSHSLRNLQLYGNGICYIRTIISAFIPNLEELNLFANRLYTYTFILGLEHLRSLDICYQAFPMNRQYKNHFQENTLGSSLVPLLNEHNICDMDYNTILKAEIQSSEVLIKNPSKNRPLLFYWPSSLTHVDAVQIGDMIHVSSDFRFYIWNHKNIGEAYIDFSKNRIPDFQGSVEMCHPATALHIYFDMNEVFDIAKNAFGKNFISSLVELDFSNNNLGNLLSKKGGPFPYLYNLKQLDLSYNNIFNISPNVINGSTHPYLKVLKLKNNKLLDIPSGVTSLETLVTLDISVNIIVDIYTKGLTGLINLALLDISRNRISYLNRNALSQLSVIITRNVNTFQLDLRDNPIECSCRSLYFLRWVYRHQRNLVQFGGLSCYLKGREMKFYLMQHDILPYLERHCLSMEWLYVMSGILVSVLVCLTISVVAYRHRWDIKYLCLRLKIRRELYAELFVERDFQYDAFVTYSEKDSSWVENHLIPNLEGVENPFCLCVHHRDFEIGRPIEECIMSSISTSHKTIILLSKHFVRSDWCKFEMHMARVHMMERGVDKIIVILLEEVPSADMPRTLLSIMRSHTYLVWPKEDMTINVHDFWSRLRSALR